MAERKEQKNMPENSDNINVDVEQFYFSGTNVSFILGTKNSEKNRDLHFLSN